MMPSRSLPDAMYLGNGRSLIRQRNGLLLCIDGESIDSLHLITSDGIEPDVVGTFLDFLRPDSVVLDIGANFGYFSTLAGSLLNDQGRLYAFEANPRTFACLQRSLAANNLHGRHQVVASNLAVGEADGETTFFFEPDALGGASRFDRDRGNTRSTVMPMRSIDSLLPAELAVDLVKIDVEGYEPFVLRGMRQVLERSPDVRIIVEMFTGMLDSTFGTAQFRALVRELDFGMCRIMPDSSLMVVPDGEPLLGEHYVMLTRTPEQDAMRRGRPLPLRDLRLPGGEAEWADPAVFWNRKLLLPADVLFHGPYAFALRGGYELELQGRLRGPLKVTVQTDTGRNILVQVQLEVLPASIPFDLPEVTNTLEVVANATEQSEYLRLDGLLLRRRA